jgi:hypothetical protein
MCAITEAVVATDMRRRRRIQVLRSRPPSRLHTLRARSSLACLCCVPAHTAQQFARACAERARGVATRNALCGSFRNKIAPARSLFDVDVHLDRRASICCVSWATPTSSANTATLCSTYCDGLGLRGGAQGLLISYIRISHSEENG